MPRVAPAPTPPAERDAAIDALRGVALFGVLVENLQHFASPSYAELVASGAAGPADRLGLGAIRLFCDNKVYLLFGFLFGYGIALQWLREARDERGFARLELWRMACLFWIGLGNLQLWSGDILTTYAVLGCALLPLRRRSDALLAGLAACLLAAPTLALAGIAAGAGALGGPRGEVEARVAAHLYPARQSCFSFAMLALGLAAGRRRLLSDAAWLARARRAVPLALGTGLAGNLAFAVLEAAAPRPLSGATLAREATLAVAAPALAFAYAVLALGWARRGRRPGALGLLAAVGRTSLSNYVAQSAVGSGVVARLGPIHPPAGFLLTLAVFSAELWASSLWLRRFRFGPLEWIWRSLAYGRREPLRDQLR
jgi:uncharacterized protein